MNTRITKREMRSAKARHAAGERWYDGPELFNAVLGESWMGIGTRDELDAMKADGVLPTECTYQPVTPEDLD